MSTHNCPKCRGELKGRSGVIAEGAQAVAALFGLATNTRNTLTGQGSKYTVLKCADCGSTFSICPHCDTPTEASLIQAGSEIRCRGCRNKFVVTA